MRQQDPFHEAHGLGHRADLESALLFGRLKTIRFDLGRIDPLNKIPTRARCVWGGTGKTDAYPRSK
jgi:hypothetical protein